MDQDGRRAIVELINAAKEMRELLVGAFEADKDPTLKPAIEKADAAIEAANRAMGWAR